MELNDEEIEILSQLASTFASNADMALALGITKETFETELRNSLSHISQTVKREQILMKSKVLKSVFNMAANGSSVAQQIAIKIIEKRELDDELN